MLENFEYYKVFYHVGRLGSITLAAKELSISQPAVSQSIHQLESSLSCTLFQRTARGMKLTSEGALLYRYAERGYQEFDLGEKRLKQLLHLDAGEVRIGASDMTLRFFLLPYLEKFHELHPGIKVTVTNGPTPETLSYLDRDLILIHKLHQLNTEGHNKAVNICPCNILQMTPGTYALFKTGPDN